MSSIYAGNGRTFSILTSRTGGLTGIYWDDGDRDNFLDRLGSILLDTRTQCLRLGADTKPCPPAVRTGLVPIATVMRRLLTG